MRLTCRLEFEKRLLNVLEVKSLCCEHGSLLPNWEHALVMAQCVARPSRHHEARCPCPPDLPAGNVTGPGRLSGRIWGDAGVT